MNEKTKIRRKSRRRARKRESRRNPLQSQLLWKITEKQCQEESSRSLKYFWYFHGGILNSPSSMVLSRIDPCERKKRRAPLRQGQRFFLMLSFLITNRMNPRKPPQTRAQTVIIMAIAAGVISRPLFRWSRSPHRCSPRRPPRCSHPCSSGLILPCPSPNLPARRPQQAAAAAGRIQYRREAFC